MRNMDALGMYAVCNNQSAFCFLEYGIDTDFFRIINENGNGRVPG